MASFVSEFNFPNFIQYYLTLCGNDYDMAGTYGEPLPFSQEELGFFFPDNRGGEVLYEHAPTEETYEWDQWSYDGTINWLGMYESYSDGGWGENQFSGVDALNSTNGSELEKAGEEKYRGGYYRYGDDSQMQAAYDYNAWFGDEYGNDNEFLCNGRDEVDYSYNWDEMKLCESIFGAWPCLLKHNQESYAEERVD